MSGTDVRARAGCCHLLPAGAGHPRPEPWGSAKGPGVPARGLSRYRGPAAPGAAGAARLVTAPGVLDRQRGARFTAERAGELVARGDVELAVDLVEVVFDRAG